MITFIVAPGHGYTVEALQHGFPGQAPPVQVLSYAQILSAREVAGGSYVFCDFERLSDLALQAADEIFQLMAQAPNTRCFNPPAKSKVRYALLRNLFEAGINSFDCYRADGVPRPKKFPVFVRQEAAHGEPLTSLLQDQPALDQALEALAAGGAPLRGCIVIEFCGEASAPGLWRRYGAFNLGGKIHLDHTASDTGWNVKYGRTGLVDEATYAQDDADIRANAYHDVLQRAFEIAAIDYGRADFGLVNGRPQIYEINTNPNLAGPSAHPSPVRTASLLFSAGRFVTYLRGMDLPSLGPPVALRSIKLRALRQALAGEL